jgi:hypothetical protein
MKWVFSEQLKGKVAGSLSLLRRVLGQYHRPVVASSFGKDSMVLLSLVLFDLERKLPVVFHREPFFPKKYEFADSVIRLWELSVYDFPPERASILEGNGHIEVFNHYGMGNGQCLHLPTGCYDPVPGEEYLCGRDDILKKPKGRVEVPWDLYLIGHRSDDVDPIQGRVPLAVDVLVNGPGAASCFPLRHWTEEDIWEYTEKVGLPIAVERYEKVDGRWGERADKRANWDWMPVCTECMKAGNPVGVPCPKLGGIEVSNISGLVPRFEPGLFDYYGEK